MPSVLNFTIDKEIKVPKYTKFMYHIVFQIDLIYGSHYTTLSITTGFSLAFQPYHNGFSPKEREGGEYLSRPQHFNLRHADTAILSPLLLGAGSVAFYLHKLLAVTYRELS